MPHASKPSRAVPHRPYRRTKARRRKVTRIVRPPLPTDGWRPGPHAFLTAKSMAADIEACAELRCGGCGRKGLGYRPWHLGLKYRVQAVCPECGAVEEV